MAQSRVRTYAYCALIVALFTAAYLCWVDVTLERPGVLPDPRQWGGLVYGTLVVFGYTLYTHRAGWRQLRFWLVLGGLLLLHLAILGTVVATVSGVRPVVYGMALWAEVPLVAKCLQWFGEGHGPGADASEASQRRSARRQR